ncbi:MAG: ribonuclease III [Elusimicrobia bacterium]|nr:ribonuclease III [Elusimicrobiota bacterium]
MKTIESLIEKLGVEFEDKSFLDVALLHRSYSSAHQIEKDNERLEFLGDSILNACVSDIIFRRFPEKDEGDLTKIRARLVSRKALRVWGNRLGLSDYIQVSDKMKDHISTNQTHIVENAMEAIVGAIYLDRGYEVTYAFVENYMKNQDFHKIVDFKSHLQELSVEIFGNLPEYKVLAEEGPAHRRKFKVAVLVNDKVSGKGKGNSKKEAEQAAAEKAYKKISEDR